MTTMPSPTIETVPLGKLKPWEKNPRKNHAVDKIAASIEAFGYVSPIIVQKDTYRILAGHGRLEALKKRGVEQVPVVVVALTDNQADLYTVADNKLVELSDWDEDRLGGLMANFSDKGLEIDLTGFDRNEIADIMEIAVDEEPPPAPAPPDEATTEAGDIWELGDHRLMCGDSSKIADLDALLAGGQIHLVNTDPPYNVRVEPRSNNAISAGLSSFSAPKGVHHQKFDLERHPDKSQATHRKMRAKDRPLENDFVSEKEFDKLLRSWFNNISRVLLPGRAFYIWGGYSNVMDYPQAIRDSDLYMAQIIVWVKEHPVLTRKDFMGNHESCFYGWRKGAAHEFMGPHNATDVWSVKKINPNKMIHLTEKPVELAVRALQYSSRTGEHVLDLFGGSGSTLIGCEQAKRKAFLMELDTLYCDVIVQRWQQFTGKKAKNLTRPQVEVTA